MGENFSKLAKEYEEHLVNEYAKSGKTHVDSIPALYKDLLDEIDRNIKLDYEKSIKDLHDNLRESNFKDDIFNSYKSITDDSIQSLGHDSELSRILTRETAKIEERPTINLSEAIELRKNINEILRNYNKNKSNLKEFRAKGHLEALKQSIDNSIQQHLNKKVQNAELTSEVADGLYSSFKKANENYAKVKELLSDKFAKAINKGMSKKDLDSRLSVEQWRKRVLDTDWGDSIKGLENTIFNNFNPKMQADTQVLLILRALDRNVNALNDSKPIDMVRILNDLEKLENLTLAPKVYPILDLFKSYANAYQFAIQLAKPKSIELSHGGGALATTLIGRIKVFLTNRMFKKLFAFVPYLGDNNAVLKSLSEAVQKLKYPSEITLETLRQLREVDLKNGHKPNNLGGDEGLGSVGGGNGNPPKGPNGDNPGGNGGGGGGNPRIPDDDNPDLGGGGGASLKDSNKDVLDSSATSLNDVGNPKNDANNNKDVFANNDRDVSDRPQHDLKRHSLRSEREESLLHEETKSDMLNLTTQGQKTTKVLREELKEKLQPIINQDITNKATGLTGRITTNERDKIGSDKAIIKSIKNGFSKEEHFKAGENIEELFINAKLRGIYEDYKKGKK